jgi:hypothetical protein
VLGRSWRGDLWIEPQTIIERRSPNTSAKLSQAPMRAYLCMMRDQWLIVAEAFESTDKNESTTEEH